MNFKNQVLHQAHIVSFLYCVTYIYFLCFFVIQQPPVIPFLTPTEDEMMLPYAQHLFDNVGPPEGQYGGHVAMDISSKHESQRTPPTSPAAHNTPITPKKPKKV